MKNFIGRLIVLISGVTNVILFLIMIGTFIFYWLSSPQSIAAIFTGELALNYYISIGLVILVLIFYFYLTTSCIIAITRGKRMKKTMVVSIFMFVALLSSFIYNVVTTPTFSPYYAFFYGIEIALMFTTAGFFIGSLFNYRKDCK